LVALTDTSDQSRRFRHHLDKSFDPLSSDTYATLAGFTSSAFWVADPLYREAFGEPAAADGMRPALN
jgi:hypothetical protein